MNPWCGARITTAGLAVLAGLFFLGCQPVPSESPPLPDSDIPPTVGTSAARAADPSSAPSSPPTSVAEPAAYPLRETWDAIYFAESKVGYARTSYYAASERGQSLVRIEAASELNLERFGQSVRQKMTFHSLETPEGQLLRCGSSMINQGGTGAPVEINTSARVEGNQLSLEITTLGRRDSRTIAWEPTWGGFFAVEQSLERQPMRPGEQRQLQALLPGLNQLGTIQLTAREMEATDTLTGNQSLLRIDARLQLANTSLDQTLWTDPAGQSIKSVTPALQQVTYRTTRDVALEQPAQGSRFDLGERTVVQLKLPSRDPHGTQQAIYRARLSQGDVLSAFARGATQQIRGGAEGSAEIIVRALRPDTVLGTDFPADSPSGPADLRANALIQSDDPLIHQLALSVAGQETDHWKIAVALESLVKQYVNNKSFAQAMASAADVVRSREGDCTEHAVLLAALCRARGIPARVAIGLVHASSVGGFAYHMWTEAWIADRWIPLDATLARGGIGAAHLKVSHSNLDGVDPFSQFLPVFQLLGNLKLEVVDAR
ncbi:MAG: transglutaminase family protein [Pirellulaceae bacterium]